MPSVYGEVIRRYGEDMHRFFFRLSERLPAESTATGEESIR